MYRYSEEIGLHYNLIITRRVSFHIDPSFLADADDADDDDDDDDDGGFCSSLCSDGAVVATEYVASLHEGRG